METEGGWPEEMVIQSVSAHREYVSLVAVRFREGLSDSGSLISLVTVTTCTHATGNALEFCRGGGGGADQLTLVNYKPTVNGLVPRLGGRMT